MDRPARVWLFPIHTVNQSESGFALTFQEYCVHVVWPVELRTSAEWQGRINLAVRSAT